ncbi:molecular chaperone [Eggerthella sp. YY7918]|uniref:TorD/DmsD family molecular chaperone n=1 Tax=Eggerthella sp. (strain YY7918) TaxID=502558 RepID=UPI0002171312|nr:molecular chaperone TorD family protein [Eggerthella sp. YY7918]BAK45320.1 hypothetical protein EGYY_22460 [Eggerthella sp. YY7918]
MEQGTKQSVDSARMNAAESSVVYALFASALSAIPDKKTVDQMISLLEATGTEASSPVVADKTLIQRFYDRMVIATSTLYIPAIESCMRYAREDESGRIEAGQVDGSPMTEVSACYRIYGFDARSLQGFQPLVGSLRPDHLVVELAFMAQLRLVQAGEGVKAQAAQAFADEFLARHLSWVPTLCEFAHQRGEEDVYVQLLEAVKGWIQMDAS